MDRKNIEKIAQSNEDALLLAKVWDKLHSGIRRDILASTCFLTPREQEMVRYLFGNAVCFFGGFPEAERKMAVYLPDYLEEQTLLQEDSPLVCIRGSFHRDEALSHRDILGALMSAGIAREALGDICVGEKECYFFVTREMVSWVLQEMNQAGRTHICLSRCPLEGLSLPQPETREFFDTLASLRLDGVVSAGFHISRAQASEHIKAGRVFVEGIACTKADKLLEAGAKISLRGMGKIRLKEVLGESKKGRIRVTLEKYI